MRSHRRPARARSRRASTSRSPARERRERRLELGRESLDERLVDPLRQRRRLLPLPASRLGSEPVERRRAGDAEQPGARASALRIEPLPQAKCLLERRAGEILGGRRSRVRYEQVAEDVVEVRLGDLGERLRRVAPAAGGRSSSRARSSYAADPGRGHSGASTRPLHILRCATPGAPRPRAARSGGSCPSASSGSVVDELDRGAGSRTPTQPVSHVPLDSLRRAPRDGS